MRKACKGEIRCAKEKRIEEAVSAGNGSNSWLGKLERLLDENGNSGRPVLVLPEHQAAGLTREQQAEDFAVHISAISREYIPMSQAILPDRVASALELEPCANHPPLDDHIVYEILRKRKLTGGVEGDLDPRVVKSCLVELVEPIA